MLRKTLTLADASQLVSTMSTEKWVRMAGKSEGLDLEERLLPRWVPIEEMRWKGRQRGEAGGDEPPQQSPHPPTPAQSALRVYL